MCDLWGAQLENITSADIENIIFCAEDLQHHTEAW